MGQLDKILGLTQDEPLKPFASEIGGTYITGHYGDSDSVEVSYEKWQIIFDVYTLRTVVSGTEYRTLYTRIKAPFKTQDNLRFELYRSGLLSSISKLFGAQDIVVGDSDFDKAFIIKGTDEYKISTLFSTAKVKEVIQAQKDLSLGITNNEGFWGKELPEGVNELYFNVEGVIKDVEHLKSLSILFCELLVQLSKVGSAKPIENSLPA